MFTAEFEEAMARSIQEQANQDAIANRIIERVDAYLCEIGRIPEREKLKEEAKWLLPRIGADGKTVIELRTNAYQVSYIANKVSSEKEKIALLDAVIAMQSASEYIKQLECMIRKLVGEDGDITAKGTSKE